METSECDIAGYLENYDPPNENEYFESRSSKPSEEAKNHNDYEKKHT